MNARARVTGVTGVTRMTSVTRVTSVTCVTGVMRDAGPAQAGLQRPPGPPGASKGLHGRKIDEWPLPSPTSPQAPCQGQRPLEEPQILGGCEACAAGFRVLPSRGKSMYIV